MRTVEHAQGDLLRRLLRVPPRTRHAGCELVEAPGARRLVLLTLTRIGSAA